MKLRLLLYAGLALAGAAAAVAVAQPTNSSATMKISEKEWAFGIASRSLKPGSYTFVVANHGKYAHSFEVKGPGVAGKRIAGTIAPKGSKTLTVTLKKGIYTFFCPLPGHAKLGLKVTIGVGEAAPPPSTSGTSTTDTGGSPIYP